MLKGAIADHKSPKDLRCHWRGQVVGFQARLVSLESPKNNTDVMGTNIGQITNKWEILEI